MNSKNLAWLIRRHGVEMTHLSGGSHIGAILSVADIIAVLYADIMKYDAKNPKWDKRDRMILSKGHAGASIYAAIAEAGFFDTEELKTHYANGSRLSGHVSHHLPGIDFSTGSLGHGLSAGAGMAFALKQNNNKDSRVFVVLGDGECNEGSVWEAAEFANHFRLNNLVAIVDHNKMQSMDYCDKTLEVTPMAKRWEAFGWNVIDLDGHNHDELKKALSDTQSGTNKPTVIIANTIKGKSISFMEMDILWHYRFPHEGWEYNCAVNELHKIKPADVVDPYTPNGCPETTAEPENSNHTMCLTFKPDYQMGGLD